MMKSPGTSVWISAIASVALLVPNLAVAQAKGHAKKKPAASAPAKPKPKAPKQAPVSAAPTPPPSPATDESASESSETPETASKAPKENAVETSVEKADPSGAADNAPATKHTRTTLDLALGFRAFRRHLSYNDDLFGVLPPYDLNGAPAVVLAVEWYPAAASGGAHANLGITANLEYGFGMRSSYQNPAPGAEGQKFSTSAYQYGLGLRYRIPVGSSEIGLGAQFGGQAFSVNLPPPTATDAGVPDVNYKFIRPNVSGRIALGDNVMLTAGAGYLLVLSAGEVIFKDGETPVYFRKSTTSVAGVDFSLGAAVKVSERIEVRPSIDGRRYFYSMKPLADDPYVAGGALDTYYGLSISAAYRL